MAEDPKRAIKFVDSDFAPLADDRNSIPSRLNTIVGTLVHCESKTQHAVTVLSTEVAYKSLAKGACKNKFIWILLNEVMRYPEEDKMGWTNL